MTTEEEKKKDKRMITILTVSVLVLGFLYLSKAQRLSKLQKAA